MRTGHKDKHKNRLFFFLIVVLTYGGDEGGVESVIGKSEQHAGLAHTGVSYQEQLEEQVVRLLSHYVCIFPVLKPVNTNVEDEKRNYRASGWLDKAETVLFCRLS